MKHREALELVVDLLAYSNLSIKNREIILETITSVSITSYKEGLDKASELVDKLQDKVSA